MNETLAALTGAVLDTASAFGLSFGIGKFHLAQLEVALVGELVGRAGRKPDPRKIDAIKNFAIPGDLNQLQQFLGIAM